MTVLRREVNTLINARTIKPDHSLSQLLDRVENKNKADILRTDIDALERCLADTEQSNLNQKNTCKIALLTTLNKSFPNLNTSHFHFYSGDEPKQRQDLNRIVKTALKSLECESYSDPNITCVSSAKKSTLLLKRGRRLQPLKELVYQTTWIIRVRLLHMNLKQRQQLICLERS